MRTDYPKYFVSVSVVLLLTWTLSCSGRAGKKSIETSNVVAEPSEEVVKAIRMIAPDENTGFKLKDQIKVVLAAENKDKLPDSVAVFFDSKHVTTIKTEPWECSVPSSFSVTTGRKSLKVTAYIKVVHTYPHSRDAFTQGLVYDNGVLFEGTGQETGSSLREVELETGKVLRQHNLDASLFGEGIALYRDRIYQVTWENKVGFIYDKSTFNVINKIYYSTQGWGLTAVNDRIVMSDGTNVLYFFEPEMFTVVSRIEVYDNKEKIDSLNELEYINGEIWANIWMSDRIARIDPVSGKVIGYIDLTGLLSPSDRNPDTDVLNGIAYDNNGKRIFVTGKRWPKLFEIKVTE